jgi:hypothetical protein
MFCIFVLYLVFMYNTGVSSAQLNFAKFTAADPLVVALAARMSSEMH